MISASTVDAAPIERVIGDLAIDALRDELACFPKPGLVSFQDSGSHADMSADTFVASIEALSEYFEDMAHAGAEAATFATLNRIGRAAEHKMLVATNGVNTHRGALFSLGLLAASAGFVARRSGVVTGEVICIQVRILWGDEILASDNRYADSNGGRVRRLYAVPGAREHAAAGFPTVRSHSLPAFRKARKEGLDRNWSGVHAFLASLATLDDTNLLHRGGTEALSYARRSARDVLDLGGALTIQGQTAVRKLHNEFVAAWLSPGGSADMLAICYFLADIEAAYGERA